MKLRKLAAVVAATTALIVGLAPSASAREGYSDVVTGAGVSQEETHISIINLPAVHTDVPGGAVTFTLPGGRVVHKHVSAIPAVTAQGTVAHLTPAAVSALVASWGISTPSTIPTVTAAINAGAQAHHINTPHTAFTGLWWNGPAGTDALLSPVPADGYYTLPGSTVIVLRPELLQNIPTGQHREIQAVFDGVEVDSHRVTIHAVGIDLATTPGYQGGAGITQHPATGPATLLYAVGALLLAGGGTAIAASARRRKAENV